MKIKLSQKALHMESRKNGQKNLLVAETKENVMRNIRLEAQKSNFVIFAVYRIKFLPLPKKAGRHNWQQS